MGDENEENKDENEEDMEENEKPGKYAGSEMAEESGEGAGGHGYNNQNDDKETEVEENVDENEENMDENEENMDGNEENMDKNDENMDKNEENEENMDENEQNMEKIQDIPQLKKGMITKSQSHSALRELQVKKNAKKQQQNGANPDIVKMDLLEKVSTKARKIHAAKSIGARNMTKRNKMMLVQS